MMNLKNILDLIPKVGLVLSAIGLVSAYQLGDKTGIAANAFICGALAVGIYTELLEKDES